jgi:hypothetical protein
MPEVTTPGCVGAQIQGLGTVAGELEGNLLEVEDDVGGVFDHSGDGLELVQHALDANRGYRCALDGAEQRAAQCIANGGAKAPLKWLGAELSVSVAKRLGVDRKALRFLESSPQHIRLSFPARRVRRDAFCGGRASSPSF